jgi:succinoglycan biosynthesis transport protein ExoP
MQEELEEKQGEGIPWEECLAVGRRRVWYFAIPLVLTWLAVWVVSWFLPAVYRSGTLILVEQPTVSQQYVVPNVAGDLQDRLNSITQQILSRTRLLRIMEEMNLYQNERKRMGPDQLVDRMRKDVEIELVRSADRRDELSAFNIYYSSSDPVLAQKVTDRLAWLFITENLEVRQEQAESTTEFLQTQLGDARQKLSDQERRLREYKDRYPGELPAQASSNVQILGGLQSQLVAEMDALGRAKQQNTYLESLLTQYRSARSASRSGTTVTGGLPAVDAELQRLHAQLADLSAHYTDRHPDVRKVKEQIATAEALRQKLLHDPPPSAASTSGDDASTAASVDGRDGSGIPELESQLKANKMEIANRQRSIQDLEGQIRDYRARLEQAPKREQELADITRDYEQSRQYYDSLLAKKNQSEMATNLEKKQQGEHFRVLDPPSVPTKPFSPNRLKLALIGLVAGIALGAVVASGSEVIDGRIHNEKDLCKLVSVEILAEIPSLPTADEQAAAARNLRLQLLGGVCIVLCIAAGFAISFFRR